MAETIRDLAEAKGIKTYDTAIPQYFFDAATSAGLGNPGGHIVWGYDDILYGGEPVPLTRVGERILATMAIRQAASTLDMRESVRQ